VDNHGDRCRTHPVGLLGVLDAPAPPSVGTSRAARCATRCDEFVTDSYARPNRDRDEDRARHGYRDRDCRGHRDRDTDANGGAGVRLHGYI
jgi:hypothetical protein